MDKFEVYFDGACFNKKEQDTPMGIGLVVKKNKEIVYCLAYSAPFNGTSNVAEWIGCFQALHACQGFTQGSKVVIYSDSQLIVNQINRDFSVNEKLSKFFHVCDSMLQELSQNLQIKIIHIPRERNVLADQLSKVALKLITK